MPKDFSAHQIRATQIVASGGVGGKKLGLAIYSASISSDYAGAFGKDSSLLSGVGSDVFLFISGSVDSKISKNGTGNSQTGVTLFGGDVVVSGTFYAERIIAEVDETTTGSLNVSGSLVVSRSAEIRENLTVFEDATFKKDVYVADDIWVSGGMRVSKSTVFDGDITVAEDSTFSKDLKVADDLWVSGGMRVAKPATFDLDGTFSKDLYVADDLWVSGGMKVSRSAIFDGDITVAEDSTFSKDLYVADDLWVSGGMKIAGSSSISVGLTVVGPLQSLSDVIFEKDLHVVDDLHVSGNVRAVTLTLGQGPFDHKSGLLSMVASGSAVFEKDVTVDDDLWVSGGMKASKASAFDNSLSVAGQLNADATTQATSKTTGALVVDGGAGIAKKVHIGQETSIEDSLFVSGTVSATTLTVAEDSTFSKDLHIVDDLWVSGGMKVAKAANFDNLVSVGSTLSVTEDATFSKDVKIVDDLHVSGNMRAVTLTLSQGPFDHKTGLLSMVASGSAVFEKDVTVDDDLWVSGGMRVAKQTTFDDDSSFSKDLYVADDLWVSGGIKAARPSTFDSSVTFSEDTIFSKDIKVADDVWVSGSIRVAHPSTFVDDVAFSKDVSITDDLHVSGNMRADTLTLSEGPFDHKSGLLSMVASGSAVFEKDVTVDDDLWVSGAIKVSKPSTFDNTLTVAEDGSFSKDLYIADDLWVSGGIKVAKAAAFDNSVSVAGQLNADATTQATSKTTGALIVDGGAGIAKKVHIGQEASIEDDLYVSGTIEATSITAAEDSTFSKDLYVADDLWVSGGMKVAKAATFDNTLTVAEDGSFSKDLYVADDLWVSGSATLAKLSIVSDFYVPDDLWVSGGLEAAHGYIVNRLVVGNGAGDEELRISAGNAATGSLVFSKNNGESGEITFDANENIVVQNNTNNDDIIFKVTDNNTLTEVMRIDGASSTVAIGATSNSVAKLLIDVTDGDDDHGLKIEQNDAGERGIWVDSEGAGMYMTAKEGIEVVVDKDNGYGFLTSRNKSTVNAPLVKIRDQDGDEAALRVIQESTDTSAFAIEISNAGGVKTTLSGSGRVGIGTGTSAYSAMLHVKGIARGDGIVLEDASSTDTVVKIYESTDDGVIDVYANNAVTSRIHGNGMSFVGGDLQVTGTNLDIAEKIRHLGDSDTYIQLDTDAIRLFGAGTELINANKAENTISFNSDGAAINTVIHTDNKLAFAAGTVNGGDQILIMSGGAAGDPNYAAAADALVYVSGAIGSRATAVRGTSVFGGDLLVSGSVYGLQDSYFLKDVSITDDVWVSGSIKVSKPSAFDNTLSVAEDATFSKDISVTDDVWVSGSIKVSKPSTFDTGLSGSITRIANGTSYIAAGNNITVTSASNGQIVISSTAGGSGDITSVVAGTGLTGGATSGDATLAINDSIVATLTGSIFSGDVVFNKDIKVTDDVWVSGSIKVAEPSTFDDTLTVAEDVSFSKDLHVADDLWVSGGMKVANAASFTKRITVSEDSTFSKDLYVTDDLWVSGGMKVAKPATFDLDGTFSKDLYVADDLMVSGAISTNLFQHKAPKFIEGLSGSITNLVNGTSYIAAGSNVTVTSASNGQIVIASTAGGGNPGGSDTQVQYNNSSDFGGISGVTTDGSVMTFGDTAILVGQDITHTGDTDTKIVFADDAIGLTVGGIQLVEVTEAGQDIVKIGNGGDVDFQVRTNGDDNTLFVQGSSDRVGIGTDSPSTVLHVKESAPTVTIQRESNANSSALQFMGQAGAIANMVHMATTNDLVFSTHDGSDQEEILRLGSHYGADNRQVILLSGSAVAVSAMHPKDCTDINFFVSGAIGSRGTPLKGTSVFGGDVVVSGAMNCLHNAFFSTDVTVTDDIWVSGSATIAQSFNAVGNVLFSSNLTVTKDITVNDDLWVSGGMRVSKPSTFDNTLTVAEDVTFSKDLYIADDLWVSGGMAVGKASTFLNTVSIAEDVTLQKDLHVADDLWVSGAMRVGKLSEFDKGISISAFNKVGIFVDNAFNTIDFLNFGPAGADVGLIVSGAIGSAKDGAGSNANGCAMFGGDIVVSGTVHLEGSSRINTRSGIRGDTVNMTDEDDVVLCFTNTGGSGGVTVTLPNINSVGAGKKVIIADGQNLAGTNNITINVGDGTNDRIYFGSPSTSTVLNQNGDRMVLVSYVDVNLTPDNGWFPVG